MSQIGAGGYHWKSEKRAEHWDGRREALSAERREAFNELVEALRQEELAVFSFVDLGAGDGQVAAAVLERHPNSSAVLVDFSDPMMERGSVALERFQGRFRYEYWDMNEGPWPKSLHGPFAAVVSSAALHHLNNERKLWLTHEIRARLSPGGVFANYDLFRDPEAEFSDDEVHDRTCATLEEAVRFLRDSGFSQVTVSSRSARPARKGELALLMGRSEARP